MVRSLATPRMLAQLRSLQAQGLEESAAILGDALVATSKAAAAPALQLFESTVLYADALAAQGQHKRAAVVYMDAMKHWRDLDDPESASLSNADVAHRLAKCLAPGDAAAAFSVLLAIPQDARTAGVNLLMGDLCVRLGTDLATAIECYKAVLRACPLALGVMAKLLRLGCPKNDLMGLVTLHPDVQGEDMQWVLQWLEGHTQAAKQDFAGAVRTFTQLELRRLPSCCAVLCNLASWLWKQGCLPAAKQAFEKARAVDNLCIDRMDVYAHVLVAQGRHKELNVLCNELMLTDKARVETWLAVARYCQFKCEDSGSPNNAHYHAQQGLLMVDRAAAIDPDHAELSMVKGTLLLAMQKCRPAVKCFRAAYSKTHDFASYQGLVSCYLASNRVKEALQIARECQQRMPRNPRAVTLLGFALMRCSDGSKKARKAFENALVLDPECMDAVFAMAELDVEEERYNDAIALLQKYLQFSRPEYMHRRLGNVYMLMDNPAEALKHFKAAITINPNYDPAREGVVRAMGVLSGNPDPEEEEAEVEYASEDEGGHH